MQTATRDDVKVGTRLFNNDPRVAADNPRKIVTILRVYGPYVEYSTGKRTAQIKLDRIYTDGKSRHQGYNLIPNTADEAYVASFF